MSNWGSQLAMIVPALANPIALRKVRLFKLGPHVAVQYYNQVNTA